MPTSRLSCPCCGYRTLLSESEGGLCEVCGWLTLPSAEQSEWKWRQPELKCAVDHFERIGASDPSLQGSVRAPRPDEIPEDGWMPWQIRRRGLIASMLEQIYTAFASVSLGRGIGLHDACVLDDYWGMKPPADYLASLPKDTAGHWRDTDPQLLERYSEFFSFTNAEGFRYYAPAYATASLKALGGGGCFDDGPFLWALRGKTQLFELLSVPQKSAIAAYLKFYAVHATDPDAESARLALEANWIEYLNTAPR